MKILKNLSILFLLIIFSTGTVYGKRSLIKAAKRGKVATIKKILAKGAYINSRDRRGKSAIMVSADRGKYKAVAYFIKAGANLTMRDYSGKTILHILATKRGKKAQAALRMVLRKVSYVDIRDRKGRTPAYYAIIKKRDKNFELLLKAGLNINGNADRTTPLLIFAYNKKRKKVVNMLLKKRISVDIADSKRKTILHYAALKNDGKIIKLVAKRKPDLDKKDSNGYSPLLTAVMKKKLSAAEALIRAGADLSTEDPKGRTTLHYLASHKKSKLLPKILRKVSDIDKKDNNGITALSIAVKKNRLRNVKSLIKSGAEINGRDSTGKTVIMIAAENGRTSLVTLLLSGGADYKLKDQSGQSLIHFAAALKGRSGLKILKLLIKKGIDINQKDNNGSTPAGRAIKARNSKNFKTILAAGLDINTMEQNRYPLFLYAYSKRQKSVTNLLLKKGVSFETEDYEGNRYIHYISSLNDRRTLKKLLKLKPKIDPQNKSGKTPLMVSIEKNNNSLAKILIKAGANLTIKNGFGQTIMHSLASQKSVSLLKEILKMGLKLEIDIKDNSGQTPLAISVNKNRLNTVKLFVELGANVNQRNSDNVSLLIPAFKNKYKKILYFLVSKGSKIKVYDKERRSLLLLALEKEDTSFVKTIADKKPGLNEVQSNGYLPLVFIVEKGSKAKRATLAAILLKAGANFKVKDSQGQTPLAYSVNKGSWRVVNVLLKAGADANGTDSTGENLLKLAYDKKERYIFEKLLLFKANPNIKDQSENPILSIAVKARKYKYISPLVNAGANLNIRDGKNSTPVIIATEKSYFSLIKYFTGKGADLNLKNSKQEFPLYIAVKNKKLNIVEYLLNHKANPNLSNKYKETPVIKAAASGRGKAGTKFALKAIKLLAGKGANLNLKNRFSNTALDKATVKFNLDIARALVGYGADVNQQDKRGNTVLKKTILNYIYNRGKVTISRKMMYLYLKNGANVNIGDRNGRTPLIDAAKNANDKNRAKVLEVVKMLLDNGADPYLIDRSGSSAVSYIEEKEYKDILNILVKQKGKTYSRYSWKTKFFGSSGNDVPVDFVSGPGGKWYLLSKNGSKYRVTIFNSSGSIKGKKEFDDARGITVDGKGNVFITGVNLGEIGNRYIDTKCEEGKNFVPYILKMNSGFQDIWRFNLGKKGSCEKSDSGKMIAKPGSGGGGFYMYLSYSSKYHRIVYFNDEGKLKRQSVVLRSKPVRIKMNELGYTLLYHANNSTTLIRPNCQRDARIRRVKILEGTKDLTEFHDRALYLTGINSNKPDRGIFISRYTKKPKRRIKFSWTRQMASGKSDFAHSVLIDKHENTYIIGETTGKMHGNKNAGKGKDIFVIKMNKEGERVWTRQFGSTGRDLVKTTVVTKNNNLIITGTGQGTFDGKRSSGGSDIFIIKLDSNGNYFRD